MLLNAKRIFMNEADAPGGNGAQPAQSPAPAQPAAQPASSVDPVEAMKSAMNEVINGFRSELTGWKNGVFADLRKSGALGKEKPVEQPTTQPAAAAPASPAASLSMADVEAMLERERVIASRVAKFGLSDAQTKRLKAALSSVEAGSLATEADAYLADMGLAKAATPNPTPANQTVQPSTQPPTSDKGSPAPGGVVNWEAEFMRDPLRMSPAAKAAMAAKHGVEQARKMRMDAIKALAHTIPVVVNERH